MEIFIIIINAILILVILIHPILILWFLKKRDILNFFFFILISIITSGVLCLFLAWWMDAQKDILLYSYGFNKEDMYNGEPFKSIPKENLEKAAKVYESKFGIGWPIRAILTYIFYFPYLVIVYIVSYYLTKIIYKKQISK